MKILGFNDADILPNMSENLAESNKLSAIAKTMLICGTISILLHCLVLSSVVIAGTENGEFCPTCPDWTDLEGWQAKKDAYEQGQLQTVPLQKQITVLKTQDQEPTAQTVSDSDSNNSSQMRTGRFAEALVSPIFVSSDDIVLDISPGAHMYIEGAVNIDYTRFLGNDGQIKPVSEMAKLLRDAGISRNDSIVIAGECLPCGGGPSPATFTYWIFRYLGHEKVRVLDGKIDDLAAAGLNTSNKSAIRPKTNYAPAIKPALFATYDFIVNGEAQIVDARSARDYSLDSIPGAVNIPYEKVSANGSIKAQDDLQKIFVGLEKDRPVVVYTNAGIEASLVWFALTLSGYDARLYTWRDWREKQPNFGFELSNVQAKPNPVRSGSITTMTASFQELQIKTAQNSSPNEDIKLTIKAGCATCGFEGFALGTSRATGNKSGTVQLSSTGKTFRSNLKDNTLRCAVIINGPDGSEAARTSLLRTTDYKYVGIWNANVAPGVYKVSINASANGLTKIFADILEIVVTG